MSELLPGTEVQACDLRWEVVLSQHLGPQTLYRLCGLESAVKGHEIDLLRPFKTLGPRIHDLHPEKAGPLHNWLVYHQAFLLEQALSVNALRTSSQAVCTWSPYPMFGTAQVG